MFAKKSNSNNSETNNSHLTDTGDELAGGKYLSSQQVAQDWYRTLYDNFPGGIGLSGPLYQALPRLLAGTQQLLQGCLCEGGCPSCVGPLGEVGERGKETAMRILTELLA